MTKVYVLNRGAGHDYNDAKRFGQLVYCTDGSLNKLDLSQMVRLISTALVDSTPDDYIVLTSLASLCSLACAIFAAKHMRLNLLIYHNGAYFAHRTVLSTTGANNDEDTTEVEGNR